MIAELDESNHQHTQELKNKISKYIIEILLDDEKTVPYRALRYKLIEKIRADKEEAFIKDDFFIDILSELIVDGKIGISSSQRYYIDNLDWPLLDGKVLTGIFRMGRRSGATEVSAAIAKTGLAPKNNWGFISVIDDVASIQGEPGSEQESESIAKISNKVTHYVHARNVEKFLPDFKDYAIVKFVELDVSAKKLQKQKVSKYIDAKIVEVIRKIKRLKVSDESITKKVAELAERKKRSSQSSSYHHDYQETHPEEYDEKIFDKPIDSSEE
ncbi:hypothetical protein MCAV_07190 [[Mycoplasma] cavipharyngis]|uniref:hypothetical protein n=1 Tax=[Mycoplasma] cavipharyngis TaxID=92757 RepID=UPI0037043B01